MRVFSRACYETRWTKKTSRSKVLECFKKAASSMTSIWLFACYEIIRLNQRFCEVLFVNVLKEVRNILTFLLARKSLFKPSISRELYRRVTCCPPTTLITIEISFKLMSRLSEALSWVKGGRNGHKAHLQPFTNSLLIDLSLSIFEKKNIMCRLSRFFFFIFLAWRLSWNPAAKYCLSYQTIDT